LRQRVIAEGVETLDQLDFLNAHHCHEGQGYLFSRAIPPEEFGNYFRAQNGRSENSGVSA
jgi:EAL domain-containing protein (putative c-di-GMP-specific phosphodiesterase class I)